MTRPETPNDDRERRSHTVALSVGRWIQLRLPCALPARVDPPRPAASGIEGQCQPVRAVPGFEAQRSCVRHRRTGSGAGENLLPVPPHLHRSVIAEVNVDQIPRSHLDVFDEVGESATASDDVAGIEEIVARGMGRYSLANSLAGLWEEMWMRN